MVIGKRRAILKGGVAASSLFLPLPCAWVWAQSEGALKLLRAPRVALVLGNSKYKDAPLKNPANDAKAISEALKSSGFDVTLKMDAGKADMAAAVQVYVQTLAAKKCVGLFYYAGHGIQLAWKNYMLPVDADIDTVGDVQKQAVEVNALMEGITKAGNPMNVIILDACRDNPFGNLKGVEYKGLSQMDAPTHTLLAYATSPGNVASDGEGANGLYTENLLREIKVPEAKIEDVFKRVRLGVRRKSNGAQIPWESTSLEEDFWFIPPKELKAASDAEKQKLFEEELALWEKTQATMLQQLAEAERERQQKEEAARQAKLKAAELQRLGEAERERRSKEETAQREAAKASVAMLPVEDYLRRYPSGLFSELAQLQLERVLAALGEKRIRIASQDGNPFTRGSAEANTKWQVGDSYSYRRTDLLGVEAPRGVVQTVSEIAGGEVRYSNGLVTDLLGNVLRRGGGRIYSPNQLEPLDYVVGKQWVTQYRITTPKGATGRNEMELRIVGREPVSVPAGTFNAFRIEGRGVFEEESGRVEVTTLTKWAAPDRLRREVAMEETREHSGGGRGQGGGRGRRAGGGSRVAKSQRWELVSFRQT
jgi:uncharacterized caspase-like protein